MRTSRSFAALLALLLALPLAPAAEANMIVTIQPSANMNNIVWTVSWDNLDGSGGQDILNWNSIDPTIGGVSQTAPLGPVGVVGWFNVGDPFTSVYATSDLGGFLPGVDGVTSSPSGFGVGLDDDPGTGDDFFLINTNGPLPVPTSGSFKLIVPGANLANYNIGVHNIHPDVIITVTDAKLSPVPEPSTIVLLGTSLVGLVGYGWRRKKLA